MKYLIRVLWVFVFWVLPGVMFAAQDDMFSGWAWSSNIGWISFNCTNTNSCGTVDYGVTVVGDSAIQPLSGWAWSPNVGWIDFSGASLVAANRSMVGTAVVYNTTQAPFRPGDPNDDGWDGIIKLNSTSGVIYGPVADTTDDTADGYDWPDDQYYAMDGFAWGGLNVGWVAFSCQTLNSCGSVPWITLLAPFYMDFTADAGLTKPTAVEHMGSYNHIWNLRPSGDIVSCTGSGGSGSWSNNPTKGTNPSPLSELVTGVTQGATSTLRCLNSEGKYQQRDIFVYVKPPPPILDFTADDYNIPYNTSTLLRWTTQNIATCSASAGDSGWNGAIATGTNITYTTQTLTSQDTTYNMQCMSMYPDYYPNPVLGTLEVTVQKLIVDFFVRDDSGNTVPQNELIAYTNKDNINLVWETEFATRGCVASDDWSGVKVSVNPAHDIVDGSEEPPIPEGGNFTFTLTCRGEYGQEIVRTVTIKVTKNPDFSEEITNI